VVANAVEGAADVETVAETVVATGVVEEDVVVDPPKGLPAVETALRPSTSTTNPPSPRFRKKYRSYTCSVDSSHNLRATPLYQLHKFSCGRIFPPSFLLSFHDLISFSLSHIMAF
jgi:hypothetical protein